MPRTLPQFVYLVEEGMAYEYSTICLISDDRKRAIDAARSHAKTWEDGGYYKFVESEDADGDYHFTPHNPRTGEEEQFGTYYLITKVQINGKWKDY